MTQSFSVSGFSGRITQGVCTVLSFDRSARLRRAWTALAAWWGVALGCVFIPVAHVLLVPSFFGFGIYQFIDRVRTAELTRDARGACPNLILLLAEEKTHAPAITTLVAIGKGAVADLTYALRHRDPHVRVGAATALGKIGADARSAVIPLSVLSRSDPFSGVRQAAQTALTLVQAKK